MHEPDELLDDDRLPPPEMIITLSEEERGLLMNELDTLFQLHDRPSSEKKRAAFVLELANLNIPSKYLFAAIRELTTTENLKTIEFWRIRKVAQERMAKDYKPSECTDCGGTGVVLMKRRDTEFKGAQTAFACRCGNGDHVAKSGLARWNGHQEMWHRTSVKSYTGGYHEIKGTFDLMPRPIIPVAA